MVNVAKSWLIGSYHGLTIVTKFFVVVVVVVVFLTTTVNFRKGKSVNDILNPIYP